MIHALLLFASLAYGQAQPQVSQKQTIGEDFGGSYQTHVIDALELNLESILRGRPTISSFITTLGSVTFATPGSGITWSDGTISTTAGGGGGGGSPTGAAGGDLRGTYPNPTLAPTQSNVLSFTSALTLTSSATFQSTVLAKGQHIVVGTATVQGNAFSVGVTTLVASNGNVGIGIYAPTEKLNIVGSSMLLDAQSLGTGASLNINAVSNGNPAVVLKAGGATKGLLFYEATTGTVTLNATGGSQTGVLIDSQDRVTIKPSLTAYDIIYATMPVIDIRAYGAIANDSISDSTPIQKGLSALTATGGTLLIPSGTFYIDQFRLVYASTRPIQIKGNGFSSFLYFNPADDTPPGQPGHFGQLNIHGTSNSSHTAQVLIRDIRFDFGKSSAAVYNTNHQGLNIHNADNVFLINNWFSGAAGEMVSLGNFAVDDPNFDVPGERAWVEGNYFSNCAQSAANPSMDDTIFVNNHLQDCSIESTGRRQTYSNNTFRNMRNGAITISSGEKFIISNNRMDECDTGAYARGTLYGCIALVGQGGGGGIFDGTITGNVITSSTKPQSQFTSGVYVTLGTNTQPAQRVVIANNTIENTYRGIFLTAITSSIITGNVIADQTSSCIEVAGILPTVNQGSFTIVNNFFANCGPKDVELNIYTSTQNIKVGPNWNPTDNTFTFSATSMTYLGQFGIGTNITTKELTIGTVGASTSRTIRINSGNSWDIVSTNAGNFVVSNFDTGNVLFTGDNAGNLTVTSSVTANSFFGDGSHLTGISVPSAEGNTFTSSKTFTSDVLINGQFNVVSTATIQGNKFSVGLTTLVVIGGNVGIRTGSPEAALEVTGDIALSRGADRTIAVSTTSGAAGKDLTIQAGNTDTNKGGDLILTSGDTTDGAGTSGDIYIYSANATADGHVILGHTGSAVRGEVCIGCASPVNTLDVGRGMVVGASYAGIITAPTYGLAVEGRIGSNATKPATQLDIGGNAQFGAGVRKSTFTNSADLVMAVGSSITLSGPNGFLTGSSSITASAFFGSGAALTGISAAESNTYTSTKTFTKEVLINAPLKVSSATATYAVSAGSMSVTAGFKANDGSASDVAYGFTSGTTFNGMYYDTSGGGTDVNFASNGTKKLAIGQNGLTANTAFLAKNGLANGYSFDGDTDSGLASLVADDIFLRVADLRMLQISTDRIQIGKEIFISTFQAGTFSVPYGVAASTLTIYSTATIIGNAFSVGGSSFSVSGGSATAAYQYKAGSFFINASTVPTVSGVTKTKTTSNQVFYSSAAAPVNLGSNIAGLSFDLARNTSYYFEYNINHQSTATATGVWFGMTYPVGSTITWTVIQPITLATASTFMSRGIEFTSAAGATVDAVDATVPAKLYGTISTNSAGTLQPRIKSELQNGRGQVMAGSSGIIYEQ